MSDVVVRRIERADLDAVAEALPERVRAMHEERIADQERGGFVYLIAWLDDRPVGFVGVGLHDDASPDVIAEARGFAMVGDLMVAEGVRRRGIGRALMLALEDEARAAGMPGVILDTGVTDDYGPARELYRALGYEDQGGVYLAGWTNPHKKTQSELDPLTIWLKPF